MLELECVSACRTCVSYMRVVHIVNAFCACVHSRGRVSCLRRECVHPCVGVHACCAWAGVLYVSYMRVMRVMRVHACHACTCILAAGVTGVLMCDVRRRRGEKDGVFDENSKSN